MTANVSRADLLAYLADHSDEEIEGIIDCFGFTSNKANTKNTTKESQSEVKINADIPKIPKESNKPLKPKPKTRPDEIFYTLTAVETSELAPETNDGQMQLPDWMADENLPPFDAPHYPSITEAIPLQQPLIVWEKLWPKLRQILSETQQKQRPDINRLVKIVADGYFPEKIPRQQKQQWAASATLLIDIPDRLKHCISDYQNLLKSLKKLRGETGLQVLEIEDRVGGEVSTGSGMNRQTKPWQMPLAEAPVLILSDAGLLAPTENDYEDWLHFGRKLKAAGCIAYLLTPLPARYLTPELTRLFSCIHWDRLSDLQTINNVNSAEKAHQRRQQDSDILAKTVLPWLSPSLLIEPELLRATCRLLQLDAGMEALCWTHADVTFNSLGFQFKPDKIERYRNQLTELAQAKPELVEPMYALLKRYHAQQSLTEFYEAIVVFYYATAIKKDRLIETAECYVQQRVKLLFKQPDQQAKLRHYSYYFLQRQSVKGKTEQDYLSSLWGILKHQLPDDKTARPLWLNSNMAAPFLNQSQPTKHWKLLQIGEQWCWTSERQTQEKNQEKKQETSLLQSNQTPVLSLETSAHDLIEERQVQEQWQTYDHLLDDKPLYFPLLKETWHLHIEAKRYTFSGIKKPNWAKSIGQDKQGLFIEYDLGKEVYRSYWQLPESGKIGSWQGMPVGDIGRDAFGIYTDITVKNTSQRFRYIPAGTFTMGSPSNEPERERESWSGSKETPHQVTLSQSFWMADTTVTQAFYQAVMGENPSHFSSSSFNDSDNNPVENVSWEDAQHFINTLNQRLPNLQAGLPTEAQWEVSCRAGTTSPFSFGDGITPEQVNYNGEYPYHQGEKGLYRQKTVPVKSLPSNSWGLYEMHGNVWEWCEDAFKEDLASDPVQDPLERVGDGRVIRGGSWNDSGRDVRSAIRDRSTPVIRDNDVGFRLILGHVSSSPVKTSKQEPSTHHQGQQRRDVAADPDDELMAEVKTTSMLDKH